MGLVLWYYRCGESKTLLTTGPHSPFRYVSHTPFLPLAKVLKERELGGNERLPNACRSSVPAYMHSCSLQCYAEQEDMVFLELGKWAQVA
jgi:hypothetical protein